MNLHFTCAVVLTFIIELCSNLVRAHDEAKTCEGDTCKNPDNKAFDQTGNVPPWVKMALTERHLYECDLHPLSLRSDLDRYPTISLEDVNRAEDLYGDHARRLVIKNNALYGRDGAENAIVGVSSFVEEMLLLMLKRVKVPDVDFVLNCSDFPQVWKDGHRYSRQDAPVVSMCGSTEHNDSMYSELARMMLWFCLGRVHPHIIFPFFIFLITIFSHCPNIRTCFGCPGSHY